MIIYGYGCETCDICFEIEQSIKDNPLTECECGGRLHRLIPHTFNFAVQQDPKTVGHLADRNTKEMGRYELEERRIRDKVEREESRKAGREELAKRLPKGASLIDKSSYKTPWWRKGTTGPDMSLTKLSKEKVSKYIEEGKT
jgi:putative FmdB family regulatory protein